MAVGLAAAKAAWVRVLIMKIYMVANATDMVMQRTLYNVGASKLISFWLFGLGNTKNPKQLMEWINEDLLSNRAGKPRVESERSRDKKKTG